MDHFLAMNMLAGNIDKFFHKLLSDRGDFKLISLSDGLILDCGGPHKFFFAEGFYLCSCYCFVLPFHFGRYSKYIRKKFQLKYFIYEPKFIFLAQRSSKYFLFRLLH